MAQKRLSQSQPLIRREDVHRVNLSERASFLPFSSFRPSDAESGRTHSHFAYEYECPFVESGKNFGYEDFDFFRRDIRKDIVRNQITIGVAPMILSRGTKEPTTRE